MSGRQRGTITIGRLVITTVKQGGSAPVVDGCRTRSADGWTAGGWCVRPRGTPGIGIVVAWRGWSGPTGSLIQRLVSVPIARRLFLMRVPR